MRYSFYDFFSGEAEPLHEIILRADLAELIVDADPFKRRRPVLCQNLCDCAAEAAGDLMVLCGDDGSGLTGTLKDALHINGLYGKHIDHAGLDALGHQLVRGLQRLGHHDAVSHDRHVRPLPQQDALADGELGALRIDLRDLTPGEAHIMYAVGIGNLRDQTVHHNRIRGLQNRDRNVLR